MTETQKQARLEEFYRSLGNRRIVIFGYGRRGRSIQTCLPSKIAYFVDNDPGKWRSDKNGGIVANPDILRQEHKDAVVVIIVSYYYRAILWQLEEMGFTKNVNVYDGLELFGDILNAQIACEQVLSYDPARVWLRGDPHIEGNCLFAGNNVVLDGSRLINTTMGLYSYVGRNCTIRNTAIGKFCSIGTEVMLGPERHPTRGFISTYPAFYMKHATGSPSFVKNQLFDDELKVLIGNDVWIGSRAIILGGVSLGDGCIVGAGSLVTKDVAPYRVIAGIPGKPIRSRYNEEDIELLLDFKWWDKDIDWIRGHAHIFSDEARFLEMVRSEKCLDRQVLL